MSNLVSKRVWRVFLDGACSNNHKIGKAGTAEGRRAGYGIWIEPHQTSQQVIGESNPDNASAAAPSVSSMVSAMASTTAQQQVVMEFNGALPTPPEATNNRAELLSLITALQLWFDNRLPASALDRLELLMDSQYTVKIATEWLPGWRRRNFTASSGKPVLNLDLVRRLDALLLRAQDDGRDFSIVWTRAHQREPADKSSDEWRNWHGNQHADRLACAAAAASKDSKNDE